MLCNMMAQQSTDLPSWRCRAAGVGLCGEEQGCQRSWETASVSRSWGGARHGEQGSSSLPPCCSPSLPANSAQQHWCCHLLAKMLLIPHTDSPMSPQMTTHPTVYLSTWHYACRHSYLTAAQTFKLPPSQLYPCAWIRANCMGQLLFSPEITRPLHNVI